MFSLKIYWIIKILQIQVNDNSRDVEKDNKKTSKIDKTDDTKCN